MAKQYTGIISLKDNYSAVMRKAMSETRRFQKDLETTKKQIEAQNRRQLRIKTQIISDKLGITKFIKSMEPYRKQVINLVAKGQLALKSAKETFDKIKNTFKKPLEISAKVAKASLKAITSLVAGAMAAGAVIGAPLIMAGLDSQNARRNIRGGTGAKGGDLEALMQSYRTVTKGLVQDNNTVSKVISDLNTRTGATGKTLEDLAFNIIETTRILGGDLNSMVRNSTRLLGDWSINLDQSTSAMDKMFIISQGTGITVDTLAEKLVQFGAPLRQMGFQFETSAALIGKFEKEGVNTELVLSSLRMALAKMARSGVKDTAQALDIVMKKIKNAGTVGEATAISMEVFGARLGADMGAAIREGRFEIDSLIESMKNSSGAIKENSKDTMMFSEKMSMFKKNVALAFEPLGNFLINVLEPLLPKIAKFFDDFVASIDFNGVISKLTQAKLMIDSLLKAPEFTNFITEVINFLAPKFEWFIGVLQWLKGVWIEMLPSMQTALESAFKIMKPIWELLFSLIKVVVNIVKILYPVFKFAFDNILKILDPIIEKFSQFLGILKGITDFVGGGLEFIVEKIYGENPKGKAIGMPYVPYDNYPAMLHQGERVLTANENRQTNNKSGFGGSIEIAKLADTLVIREESDIDKIANALVKKLYEVKINR